MRVSRCLDGVDIRTAKPWTVLFEHSDGAGDRFLFVAGEARKPRPKLIRVFHLPLTDP